VRTEGFLPAIVAFSKIDIIAGLRETEDPLDEFSNPYLHFLNVMLCHGSAS
jgi:hypothetical protein